MNDKKKPRRSTKFDFSGTNYESCTLGHVACLEAMLEEEPNSIGTICDQAREIGGGRKPAQSLAEDDKYASLKTDPEFMARALLFKKGKKTNGRDITHKDDKGSKDGDDQLEDNLDNVDEGNNSDCQNNCGDGGEDDLEITSPASRRSPLSYVQSDTDGHENTDDEHTERGENIEDYIKTESENENQDGTADECSES
jgi:hypothetical protein